MFFGKNNNNANPCQESSLHSFSKILPRFYQGSVNPSGYQIWSYLPPAYSYPQGSHYPPPLIAPLAPYPPAKISPCKHQLRLIIALTITTTLTKGILPLFQEFPYNKPQCHLVFIIGNPSTLYDGRVQLQILFICFL